MLLLKGKSIKLPKHINGFPYLFATKVKLKILELTMSKNSTKTVSDDNSMQF